MFEDYLEEERQGLKDALHSAIDNLLDGDSLLEQYDWDTKGEVGFTAGVCDSERIQISICSQKL